MVHGDAGEMLPQVADEIVVQLEKVKMLGREPRPRMARVRRPVPGPNSTTRPVFGPSPSAIARAR